MRLLAALIAGVLFGFGLAISGMTDPRKVLGFLDVAGRWDPTLLFVMAGAVSVTLVAFRFVLRRPRPLFGDGFALPALTRVDLPLLAGAALFGIGWGLAGYCPGPVLANLAALDPEALVFVPAMLAGMCLHRRFAVLTMAAPSDTRRSTS